MKLSILTVSALSVLSCFAAAGQYDYAVWGSGNGTSLSGTVGGVGVSFVGPYQSVLTNGANNYYDFAPSTYISTTVSNAPVPSDNFIQLFGGNTVAYSLTFSAPVKNLVLSVLSVGQGGDPVAFNFDVPVSSILSQGTDQWSGNNTDLSLQNSNFSLVGTEGSGSILFSGTTTTIDFTLPNFENWYGLTVATPAAVPEPSSFAVMGLGAGAFALLRRRRK